MRKSVILLLAFAASVVPAIVAAQQAGTSVSVSREDMFVSDNPNESGAAELTPGAADWFKDAAKNAWNSWDNRAPGQCPKPTITVNVPKSADPDPNLLATLAAARRDALKAVLGTNADKFTWVDNPAGQSGKVEIDPTVTDTAAPRITVSPPSGTKVKSGRRMTINVTATEPESGWQSGIKRIQIEDVDQHSNLRLWDNDAPTPRPCGNAGLTKTIEATAEVPERPVWHLRVTAIDYSNNRVVEKVDYPTGDWYGTLDLLFITPAYRNHARLDITIDYDGRSNLTGQIWEGKVSAEKPAGIPCAFAVASPAMLSATLIGQYTPRTSTMSLTMRDEKVVLGHLVCPPVPGGSDYGHGILSEPKLAELLRSFTIKDDGSVDETRTDTTVPQNKISVTLKLNRVRN